MTFGALKWLVASVYTHMFNQLLFHYETILKWLENTQCAPQERQQMTSGTLEWHVTSKPILDNYISS